SPPALGNPDWALVAAKGDTGPSSIDVANDGTTGTTANKLAKLTGDDPSTAVVTAVTDISGALGIVVGGAGTTGNAQINRIAIASCVFDGATPAGDYVTISATTAGDCHDAGATFPTSGGQILGRVLSTNGAGGTYAMVLFPGELPIAETPASPAVVGSGRQIATSGAALSGGGDLSANRTITLSASPNSASVVGTGRQVATSGAALSGGGDLSADRTLSFSGSCAQALTFSGGVDLATSAVATEVPNDTTTGTTVSKLAKLTGAPSAAIITATTDTAGAFGIVVGGAGTSGNAQIARVGTATCVFDGSTTARDYVVISSTTAGDCHDAGATFPTSGGQVLGRVLSTNGAGGTYAMILYPGELPIAETPVSPAVVGSGRQVLTGGAAMSGGGD